MTTPRLSLPLIQASQAQKEVTHNEALILLDALVQPSVINRITQDPSALTPSDGDRYIVASGAIGEWAGHDGEIAVYFSGWLFAAPAEGWIMYDEANDVWVLYDGSAWVPWIAVSGDYLTLYGTDGEIRIRIGADGIDQRVMVELHTNDGLSSFAVRRADGTTACKVDGNGFADLDTGYAVGGQQVAGARQSAISDASGGTTVDSEARTAINALLAACRSHGLIAS